ncbi:hypothetical protein SI65_06919 [Aspergillus cristatus]|uniref:Zn(2)-C6 fungal-type domain-containing protein n=1 Tax=Aspergillus cristatus TaxID=573508 RepID=A0A1E3B8J9_ASPCR|nr:hypothetical protein SI65_06919 [Aspergillus cristatus]
MADYTEGSRLSVRPVCRSSVACAACRYKHHRCDGQKPACSRCIASAKECIYPLSRRRKTETKTGSIELAAYG